MNTEQPPAIPLNTKENPYEENPPKPQIQESPKTPPQRTSTQEPELSTVQGSAHPLLAPLPGSTLVLPHKKGLGVLPKC